MRTRLFSTVVQAPAVIALVIAVVACSDAGSQREGSPSLPATMTSAPTAGATAGEPAPSTTTLASVVAGSSLLESIDPCSLLRDDEFGIFVDSGTPGVEDDLGGRTIRQCTWEGTLQDDFYTGLFLQVHAQPDIAAITFDAEPEFVVQRIEGKMLEGAAVISAPNPDVQVEESVAFIVFDAGDVLVTILPWASVFPGTPQFDALVDLTLVAADRAAG